MASRPASRRRRASSRTAPRNTTGLPPDASGRARACHIARGLWERLKFPEVANGEDACFVWSRAVRPLTDVSHTDTIVAIIQEKNSISKAPHNANWSSVATHDVEALPAHHVQSPQSDGGARPDSLSSGRIVFCHHGFDSDWPDRSTQGAGLRVAAGPLGSRTFPRVAR